MKRLINILFLTGFVSVVALPGSECHRGVCFKHIAAKKTLTKEAKSAKSHCHNKSAETGQLVANQKSKENRKSNHSQSKSSATEVNNNSNECNSMGNCYLLGELNKEPEINNRAISFDLVIDLNIVFVSSRYEILPANQATDSGKIEIRAGPPGESVSIFKRKSSYLI